MRRPCAKVTSAYGTNSENSTGRNRCAPWLLLILVEASFGYRDWLGRVLGSRRTYRTVRQSPCPCPDCPVSPVPCLTGPVSHRSRVSASVRGVVFYGIVGSAGWVDAWTVARFPAGGPSAPGRREALKAAQAKKMWGPLRCAPSQILRDHVQLSVRVLIIK